jgi:hypothetical protein
VLIQCGKIYHTNEKRGWCSKRDIRMTALPKGSNSKLSTYQKRKQREEYADRNHIEGRTGNAKQELSLNQIKPKLRGTSGTWIAVKLYVLNLSAFAARSGVTF